MKSISKIWAISSLALLSSVAIAQEEKENSFSLSAQIRPRFEYRNGAYKPIKKGEAPAILTHNRFRLNLDYQHADELGVHISLQNVSIWGQAKQVQVQDPTGGMSIFEAYAKIKLSQGFYTKVGRQMIALDDDRLFGSLDWHPAGRSHDGINLQYTPKANTNINAFVAYNKYYENVNTPTGKGTTIGQDYQHLELVHAATKINEKTNASFIFANLGYRSEPYAKANNLQTLGTNWQFKTSPTLSLNFSGYYQFGKNKNENDKSAYLLALNGVYAANTSTKVTLGIDYLSGTKADSKKDNTFLPFSGTNHKFYGYMDYYYVGINPNGLIDAYASVSTKTSARSSLLATLHNFTAPVKVGNKRVLGQELDLVYNYNPIKFVGLQVGYSIYLKTDLQGGDAARPYQDWLWVQLNVNPKLFSAKF